MTRRHGESSKRLDEIGQPPTSPAPGTRRLTPYDTGEVAEPRVWVLSDFRPDEWGKVDFDNEEGSTVATVQVVRREDGSYEVRVETYDENTQVTL